jgi:glycosyltransferase involved in cell wall biosynthesis
MQIAVNTRMLISDRLDGIGWFSYETLRRITTSHPEHTFVFLFDRPYNKEFIFSANILPRVVYPPARHPVLWYLWFEQRLPVILDRIKPDLFLSTDGFLSLRSGVPSVAVIHDLNFHHYPAGLPPFSSAYYRHYFPMYAKKAKRIATVSLFSKNDIASLYEIVADKIDVVYDGVNEIFRPLGTNRTLEVKERLTGGFDYFVFTGSLHPRKNVARLLSAYDLFRSQCPHQVKMVIVGEKAFLTTDIDHALRRMKNREDVIFAGRMQTDELARITGAALAAVFVSYFEGFGIPVLEAMQCDVPVLASYFTSIPEVAGEAALMVDPFSIESIADGMVRLANEPHLREKLVTKGRVQREKFSWDRTAEKLWKTIDKAINS